MIRTLLLAAALGLGLGACTALDSDVSLFGDSDDSAAPANGCTVQDCSQQARNFCAARGYSPGTGPFDRCVVSVEENLRKESR